MNEAGEGEKQRGLKLYRTENYQLNGNKINETGYKRDWDRQCRGKKTDKCTISQSTKIRLNLEWVVCHSDLYCDPAQPL